MSSKNNQTTEAAGLSILTERDQRVLALSFLCFKEEPKVDTDKLSRLGKYKTKASANTAWHGVKNKLRNALRQLDEELKDDDNTTADTPPPALEATPKTPRKTPKKATATKKTPAKSPKTVKKAKVDDLDTKPQTNKRGHADASEDEESEEAGPSYKKVKEEMVEEEEEAEGEGEQAEKLLAQGAEDVVKEELVEAEQE